MKSIAILLFASFVFITIQAQKNFDTVIQSTATGVIENNLSTGQTSPLPNNFLHQTFSKAITILPEAGTKNIKIVFDSESPKAAAITVLDKDGKKVLHQATHLSAGMNAIDIINFSLLNEGSYSIQLNTNNKTYTSTIIIWK